MLLEKLGATFVWESRVLALDVLRDRLLRLRASGRRCLFVVDESHKFTDAGLEAVRLLNNLEQGADKLIQVLLLGQEELAVMLTSPGREAFRQRIANLEQLGRMTQQQVRDYVRHRLRVAGGGADIFPDLVLDAVAEAAGGIPRLTNSLCDRAMLRAFEQGTRRAEAWANAHTVAAGIRVPAAIGDFLILDAVRESGGFAIAVEDDAILAARDEIGREEGLLLCPEGAATWAAYKDALAKKLIKKSDRCVLFNCADGRKYPLPDAGSALDRHGAINYARL